MLQLHYNENSLGMSPLARQAIVDSLDIGFRYPDVFREKLVSALAVRHGVREGQVSIGNGSSENIQKLVQSQVLKARALGRAVQLVLPDPTFHFAEESAFYLGVPCVKIALLDDFSYDLSAMRKAADDFDGMTIFYLCNPNNPTGTVVYENVLFPWLRALDAEDFVIVDEAYFDFVQDKACQSALSLLLYGQKNIAITRTFSKLYALAGYRVGYALADESVIALSEGLMPCVNINLAGAQAALASLEDEDFVKRSLESVAVSRALLEETLQALELSYVPVNTNFVFHEIKGESKLYAQRMLEAGIQVGRYFPPYENYNRITLGRPDEMEIFVRVLREFRRKGFV